MTGKKLIISCLNENDLFLESTKTMIRLRNNREGKGILVYQEIDTKFKNRDNQVFTQDSILLTREDMEQIIKWWQSL